MEDKGMTRREALAVAGVGGVAALGSGANAAQGQNQQGKTSRIQVIHDQQGTIIAAGYVDQPAAGANAQQRKATAVPIQEHGQSVAEVDVPGEFAQLELNALVSRLQYDVRAKRLVPRSQ